MGAPGIKWVQARDAAEDPARHRVAPQRRAMMPQMSLEQKLRSSDINNGGPGRGHDHGLQEVRANLVFIFSVRL